MKEMQQNQIYTWYHAHFSFLTPVAFVCQSKISLVYQVSCTVLENSTASVRQLKIKEKIGQAKLMRQDKANNFIRYRYLAQ